MLDHAARSQAPLSVRFACLCLPIEHDRAGVAALCERLRAPHQCRDLALLAARERAAIDHSDGLDATAVVALLERSDALRKPARLRELLQLCAIAADARGDGAYPALPRLQAALSAAQSVPTDAIARRVMAEGKAGPEVGAAIHAARIDAVAALSAS